jgi:hypothetical protein
MSAESRIANAISTGDVTAIRSLLATLDEAAQGQLLSTALDNKGSGAMHLAAEGGDAIVVHALLAANAPVDKVWLFASQHVKTL